MPDVVRDRGDRLHFVDAGADSVFVRAIAQKSQHGAKSMRSIPIPAAGERPPLILHMAPVAGAARDIFVATSCLLVATAVVPAEIPTAEVIQALLDLTPAEARIARGIANGSTVEQLAGESRISPATVLVQLRSIFDKTGVSRQVDLVRLLSGACKPPG